MYERRIFFFFLIFIVSFAILITFVVLISTNSDGDNDSNQSSKNAIIVPRKDFVGDPSTDPKSQISKFSMLAIGDWGATTEKTGSCCNKYRKGLLPSDPEYQKDYHSQINIAKLLGQSAEKLKPVAILGHGDNIYWNGVGPKDAENRMAITFDQVYTHKSLRNVPWWNVAGNHDIGGGNFICGDENDKFVPCKSSKEIVEALNMKFNLQRDYVSPINNRWIMKDHYYKESYSKNNVTVDVFNIDTNYAANRNHITCCQCWGYSKGSSVCSNIKKGDRFCAGGSIEIYNACMDTLKEWWDDSLFQAKRDLKKSTATFKIINTHYSPHFHMSEPQMLEWYKVCSDHGVNIWLNGHTHGFNHDISTWGTHFFENGGGGGIQSETSTKPSNNLKKYVSNKWIAAGAPYGFFELEFLDDWIKVQFVTFDDKWEWSLNKNKIIEGGSKRGHCWYVGKTGIDGKSCNDE